MITAVDTSVLIDIAINDKAFADKSEAALLQAQSEGKLIICEAVVAELYPVFDDKTVLTGFIEDLHLDYVPLSKESSLEAGAIFASYLKNKGPSKRVIADFLIGAHALLQSDRLLARDRGYYKTYFTGLTVIGSNR